MNKMNRIERLKQSWTKIQEQKKRDHELYFIETEAKQAFKHTTIDDIAEELVGTTGVVQHLSDGNRRILPFILL